MREVKKFEADDGTLFNTKNEAIWHDKLSILAEWYEGNKLYGNFEGCKIEWEDFLEWVKDNKAKVKEIISCC